MTKKHLTIRLLCAAVALPLLAHQSSAQSVDYGALEALFGEPITTSVTGKPQKASDVPADLVILTQDDIRRSGADNIPDLLQFVTGINVRRYSLADANVAIRGYNQPGNPRLLVMVNGRQIYLDDYGYVAWSTIPVQLDEIRQIEVVKGPNSALFGFNAASGVINIITTDPIKDRLQAATVRVGTQGLASGSVVGTASLGDTAGVRLSAGGLRAREFSAHGAPGYEGAGLPSPQSGTFNVDGRWQVNPIIQLFAEGSVVDSRASVTSPQGLPVDAHYQIWSGRLGLTADTGLGLIALDAYRNQARNAYVAFAQQQPLDNRVVVVKASDLMKLGMDHTVRLGLEYRSNTADGNLFDGQIGYKVYSGSGMWDWQIAPSLTLTNAVRVDHLTLHYSGALLSLGGLTTAQYDRATLTEPSFNSGLVWKLSDLDTVRLTAARGLQVPSLIDYALQSPLPGSGALVGNPTLVPTAVYNLELGYDRTVTALSSTIHLATFVQRNDNLLAASLSVPPDPARGYVAQSANTGRSDEIGFEIGLKGRSESGWRWNASYAFAAISDKLGAGLQTPNLTYRHGTPQHTVVVGGGYTQGRWEVDLQGRWQSSYQDFFLNPSMMLFQPVVVGNYVSFSGRLGYKLTDAITLSGSGQQFNVSRLMTTAGRPVERRLLAMATARF